MNVDSIISLIYIQSNSQSISCKINDLNLSSNQIIITDGYNIETLDPLHITNTFQIINFSAIDYVPNLKFLSRQHIHTDK
jgi:hypothetical protein